MTATKNPPSGGRQSDCGHHFTTAPAEPPDFEQIPADLKALPQWVCWRLEEREGNPTKVPYNAESGRRARSNDPSTWTTFDTAIDTYLRGGYSGIGFMFWEGDGLTGLDLDHVIDLETGEIDPRALEILERFKGTYCEISPSGTGFRIFIRGSSGRSGKNEGRGKWLEVYTHPSHRYLTVTGHHWPQSAVEVTAQQTALAWLHEKYFTKPAKPKPATNPVQPSSISMDDTALLDKARATANGHQFGQLWNGDTTAHRGDHSSADLALCSMLAFWTQKDAGRMDRLFRQSGLMRQKWERADYRQRTIDKAIAECTEVYTEGGKGKGGNGEYHGQCADTADAGYWESIGPEAHGYQADAGPEPERPGRKETSALSYRKLSDIRARPIEWTWYPYIPRRANTLLTGDSDVGKSKALAAIISTVTNGGRFLGNAVEIPPGNVIILSAEEDAETMLKPALLAAGVNCDRVYLVESCAEYDSQNRMKRRLVTMERDIEALISLGIEIGDVTLTVIDPVTAYLGTKISGNDNTAIRSVLSGLQSFAENVGAANMLTTHFGKDNSRSAKLQVLGSVAFVAGVRSVLGVFRDPQDDTGVRRLLVPVKCNLVPESDRFGIAFEIHGVDVRDGDTELPNIGAVQWIPGRVTRTADEIVSEQRAIKEQGEDTAKGISAQRQRVIDVLRAAERPLSARRIAELLEGENIPQNHDPRRVRVRRLLTKMLQSRQIDQDENELYTLADSPFSQSEEVPL